MLLDAGNSCVRLDDFNRVREARVRRLFTAGDDEDRAFRVAFGRYIAADGSGRRRKSYRRADNGGDLGLGHHGARDAGYDFTRISRRDERKSCNDYENYRNDREPLC